MFIPVKVIVILRLTGILDSMPMCSAAYAGEEPMTSLKLTKSLLGNVRTQPMVLLIMMVMAAKNMKKWVYVVRTFGTPLHLIIKKCAAPVEEDTLNEKVSNPGTVEC